MLSDLTAVGRAFGRAVDRRAAVERLRITTSRLSTLVSNLSGAVLLEDETRRIVLVNQPFIEFFGMLGAPEDLIGSDCAGAAEASKHLFADPDGFVAGVDAVLAAREPEIGKLLHLADGRVLERDFLPVIEADRYLGHLWLYRDATDRIRYEAELRDARERAEAGTRAKSAFIATMSHEIRTPLNAVINMTELLLETPLAPEQRRLVSAAVGAGRALNEIVDDVLDFSKIEAGRLTIERVALDPRELLRGVQATYATVAAQRGLGLDVVVRADVPPLVSGDPGRIRQVVSNLVSNALKFTHAGSVTAELQVTGTSLEFRVTDTGIGIAPEVQARLFRPFTQADSSTTRIYGGTGLGLAICRELVELMGGTMSLASEPGRGSVFGFAIPLEVATAAGPAPAQPGPATGSPARALAGRQVPRILIAEDTELNREVLVTLLARFPIDVSIATDGAEALERMTGEQYDLVLIDCQMPRMDGLEAARRFRAQEDPSAHLAIVALTADVRVEMRDACAAAGMDDFLAKPVDREALGRVLAGWLHLEPPGRPSQGDTTGPSATRAVPVLDAEAFRTLVAAMGGGERFRRVLTDNLQRLAARIAAATAWPEAERAEELRAAGHALAGVAAQVGARELERAARALEAHCPDDTATRAASTEADALAKAIAPAVARLRAALDEEGARRAA